MLIDLIIVDSAHPLSIISNIFEACNASSLVVARRVVLGATHSLYSSIGPLIDALVDGHYHHHHNREQPGEFWRLNLMTVLILPQAHALQSVCLGRSAGDIFCPYLSANANHRHLANNDTPGEHIPSTPMDEPTQAMEMTGAVARSPRGVSAT